MVGPSYWTTGIVLDWCGRDWSIWLDFYDDGFCDKSSTGGRLRVRYIAPTDDLPAAIDLLIADARRLGINFNRTPHVTPRLYVPGDGDAEDEQYHPEWRSIIARECRRLGWADIYAETDQPEKVK